jgi:hypothetical protein
MIFSRPFMIIVRVPLLVMHAAVLTPLLLAEGEGGKDNPVILIVIRGK